MSVHNREEALRAARLGEKALDDGDVDKAVRFLSKSIKMYPTSEAKNLLEEAQRRKQSGGGQRPPAGKASPKKGAGGLRHRRSSPKQQPQNASDARPYTAEQANAVKRVLKCKDLYQMLGVPKDANDATIKKAYRKMALKFHPDKNSAPGADEAFKEINRAFSVLSDKRKRTEYDHFGETSDNPAAQFRRQYYNQDFDPADIFREVFGAGFTPMGGVRMYNFGGGGFFNHPHGRHRGAQNQAPGPASLMGLLPLLILFVMSLTSMFQDSPVSLFSLQQDRRYQVERFTSAQYTVPDIPYYVEQSFRTGPGRDPRNIADVERRVHHQHYSFMEQKCNAYYTFGRRSNPYHRFRRKKCVASNPEVLEHTEKSASRLRDFCWNACLGNKLCRAFRVSNLKDKSTCEIYRSCSQIDDGDVHTELWINACEELKRIKKYYRY